MHTRSFSKGKIADWIRKYTKNKPNYYACASEVQSIEVKRGEEIKSYFKELLKYPGY